jgi:glycopeptide antibiotics resistance protein
MVVIATLPMDIQNHPHWQKVAWLPFVTGIVRPHDLIVNALIYVPFGYFRQACSGRDRRVTVVALAFLLSALLELAQVWSHYRFPSATDVALNVTGALIGATWARRRLSAGR